MQQTSHPLIPFHLVVHATDTRTQSNTPQKREITLYCNQILNRTPKEIAYEDGQISGMFDGDLVFVIKEGHAREDHVQNLGRVRILDYGPRDTIYVQPLTAEEKTFEERLRGKEGATLTEIERKLRRLTNTSIYHDPLTRAENLETLLMNLHDLTETLRQSPFEDYHKIQSFENLRASSERQAQRFIAKYKLIAKSIEKLSNEAKIWEPSTPEQHTSLYNLLAAQCTKDETKQLSHLRDQKRLHLYGATINELPLYSAACYDHELNLVDRQQGTRHHTSGLMFFTSVFNRHAIPKTFPDISYIRCFLYNAIITATQKSPWLFWQNQLDKNKILLKNRGFHEYIATSVLLGNEESDPFTVYARKATPATLFSDSDSDHPPASALTLSSCES